MEEDRVDRLVSELARLRPDFDVQTKAIAGRLLHLSDLVERHYGAVCERFDVSLSGLGVLVALARHAPRAVTLTEINEDILVTSGGVTFVVSRLEQQGLLTRTRHPQDGRAWLIGLTRRGRQLAGRLIEEVWAADKAVLSRLNAEDRVGAARILRLIQTGIEAAMSDENGNELADPEPGARAPSSSR